MIQHHPSLFKVVRKILSLFSSKEVKAPLSFFDRQSTKIVGLAALGVSLVQPKERLQLLIGVGVLLFLQIVTVTAIAWFRPKNLVFGEAGYRRFPANPATSASGVESRNRPAA